MPWSTPTLAELRGLNRDFIAAYLPGADASVPNSVLRVLSDANSGLAALTLQYLDWLARQLAAAPFELRVLEPQALRDELRTVAERLLRAAAVR